MVFAPILGLLGLAQAMRRALPQMEMSQAAGELVFGMATALWLFAAVAYLAKVAQRRGVLLEDMDVLPGSAGLAMATMGLMSIGGGLNLITPDLGRVMLIAGIALHLAVVGLAIWVMRRQAAERRVVSPVHHLVFGGFIVGGIAACRLGEMGLAEAILILMIPVAVAIWAASLWEIRRKTPPAALRPLLAIHLAPAGALANIAWQTGHTTLSQVFLGLAVLILAALLVAGRWVTAAGFSVMWSVVIYPLAAVIGAMFLVAGPWWPLGCVLAVAAFGAAPAVAWKVLKLWPGGRLAALTNAARA